MIKTLTPARAEKLGGGAEDGDCDRHQQPLPYFPSFLAEPTSNYRGLEGQTGKGRQCCDPTLTKGPEGELMMDVCVCVCVCVCVLSGEQGGILKGRFFHPEKDMENFKK